MLKSFWIQRRHIMDSNRPGSNPFGRYSSKTKRVNIPVPSFEFANKKFGNKLFEKSKNILPDLGSLDKENRYSGYLIGRDRITEKLHSWLKSEKNDRGSFLITGYRGMGKTCFTNKVLYGLTREAGFGTNVLGYAIFVALTAVLCSQMSVYCKLLTALSAALILCVVVRWYQIKERYCKEKFLRQVIKRHKKISAGKRGKELENISVKEWERINRFIYAGSVKDKSFRRISVNVNLGQEILDEREILCVLVSQLHSKYRNYVFSPLANIFVWALSAIVSVVLFSRYSSHWECLSAGLPFHVPCEIQTFIRITGMLVLALSMFFLFSSHQLRVLGRLGELRKRINAALTLETSLNFPYREAGPSAKKSYSYSIATTREIESLLIDILEQTARFPVHPKFYFVFDELDKIEVPYKMTNDPQPEFSNEKYLPGGGTSRKRKTTVLHLLGNLKFFTSTANAKFLFIAGREMYDAYLADMTDRESAISSLFGGIIYVESFCKNEKSDKDVMYNAETFISRQLIPHSHIMEKVIDHYIECKLNGRIYTNIDINLKLYYEYLTTSYSDRFRKMEENKKEGGAGSGKGTMACPGISAFNDARDAIDKVIVLLYHFTVYLYHISNGSPKKMRLTFENYIRPLKEPKEFDLSEWQGESPLEKADLDILIPEGCHNLLSFGEKEQRVIGFVHYISFPVNQIITDANQFGDKLLVSASFLINHIYKHHKGGFSWRNIEQTPELLEVYKIPEFRGFIGSILNFLLQTHIIQIPCGLYQYKFRKHIAEEISLASKISEEISAIFNFTLDESQTVKRHYLEIQKNHVSALDTERTDSPHSITGIHHILGDLYMADEEYNNAILEYQAALGVLSRMNGEVGYKDPHKPALMLAYIRYMLKLGTAFEKRRTLSSAYNTYNEIIGRLCGFREFREEEFGLEYRIEQDTEWPYHDAILYARKKSVARAGTDSRENVEPEISGRRLKRLAYKTKGKHLTSDFSYLMTPEKHTVIQRLSMLEDTHMIYQALLAKLFVIEKIELGGITRSNLNLIEGEYKYLHLATNEKEKFLISTDFFRRLGDIMYYKNGLLGFSFNHVDTSKNTSGGKAGHHIEEPFVYSLYYWAVDIESEIHDFCRRNGCFESYGNILERMKEWNPGDKDFLRKLSGKARQFFISEEFVAKLRRLPFGEIKACNRRRMEMWTKNRNLPCYACKYYNRSLRILMSRLFDIDVEGAKKRDGDTVGGAGKEDSVPGSKTIVILKEIIKGGSSRSMRQNYMIQMAELLDCLGNTVLSCADSIGTHGEIRGDFLAKFLHDVNKLNNSYDKEKRFEDYKLLQSGKLNKTETSILYYWEASVCFRYGNEHKKAAESMKKVLRVIQNYLRVSERMGTVETEKGNEEKDTCLKRKIIIGEFLNEIKNRLVKQGLICLYSHYNFINLMEIQRLKWIFYTQMYENISLDRLTLFPDVEEIMVIYYELIKLCTIPQKALTENSKDMADEIFEEARTSIESYSRDDGEKSGIGYTWSSIGERNRDFTERLIGIYNNMSMGALSHHHTIYERVLSLKFKTVLNQYILELAFPEMQDIQGHDFDRTRQYVNVFCDYFNTNTSKDANEENLWERFFYNIRLHDVYQNVEKKKEDFINVRMQVLEFLIKDSIYCLTEILETITPYTSTTLFTNSFMGDVYGSLHQWNVLFDSLFKYYRVFDQRDNKDAKERAGKNPDEAIILEEWFGSHDESLEDFLSKYYGCNGCSHGGIPSGKSCDRRETIYLEQEKATKQGNGNIQLRWESKCPYYFKQKCDMKKNDFEWVSGIVLKKFGKKNSGADEAGEFGKTGNLYRKIWKCRNISDRLFESLISIIDKPNIHYTLSNYSLEMALKAYRSAIEVHSEGKAYKDMISKMYYLDDDLKNDTIQFDLAIERFKINNEYIESRIRSLMKFWTNSLYDIECFCADNESRLPLSGRFPDLFWNVYENPIKART